MEYEWEGEEAVPMGQIVGSLLELSLFQQRKSRVLLQSVAVFSSLPTGSEMTVGRFQGYNACSAFERTPRDSTPANCCPNVRKFFGVFTQ
jgi:hypothetical protein